MSNKDNQLALHLAAKVQENEQTNQQLAKELDISYQYLMKLFSGKKDFARADRKVFIGAARYLDIPVAQVYLLAGALESEDFIVNNPRSPSIAESILEVMRQDPVWCGFVPEKAEIKLLGEGTKVLISQLYQRHIELAKAKGAS